MNASATERVIWHELECGGYTADLPFWRELAGTASGPVLDVGAGTGRVALALAAEGHPVTAIDLDGELLGHLRQRATAARLQVRTQVADARDFELGTRFALCAVPMQTIQLLGGARERVRFLRRAQAHLRPGGRIAIAIVEELEEFEVSPGLPGPLPDVLERDGVVYSSTPVAVRINGAQVELERRREVVSPAGDLRVSADRVTLDLVSAHALERECEEAGLRPTGRVQLAPTDEHTGSTVVIAGA